MSEERKSAGRRILSREELETVSAKAGTLAYAAPPRRTLDRFGYSPNRREVLALATAGATALLIAGGLVTLTSPNGTSGDKIVGAIDPEGQYIPGGFMYPRFKVGEFGGIFIVGKKANEYTVNDPPDLNPSGRFYIATIDKDPATMEPIEPTIIAIYQVCTHLGCLIPFQAAENRFICPCHGSTFERNTSWVRGPAPRNLDQFEVEVQEDGTILVNTGVKKTGNIHA